ncbi:hypothetical protein QR680_011794 [Steinernema hermaphroditum]|uniref:Uncharacterized protein n=1 Tax=Steinernema hermaphroditum TaxID=289476 RepID=A0AA39HZR7_9BILA|nr:hypothetical protein QR680_011794 [Steinernema hermaphroditum]
MKPKQKWNKQFNYTDWRVQRILHEANKGVLSFRDAATVIERVVGHCVDHSNLYRYSKKYKDLIERAVMEQADQQDLSIPQQSSTDLRFESTRFSEQSGLEECSALEDSRECTSDSFESIQCGISKILEGQQNLSNRLDQIELMLKEALKTNGSQMGNSVNNVICSQPVKVEVPDYSLYDNN